MEQEQEIDLLQLWEIIKKRWLIIITIPLIAALTSGIISFFILPPVYEAHTTLIVGKKASDEQQTSQMLDLNVLNANQKLAETYSMIAKSRTVEQRVIDELNLPLTAEQLHGKISVNSVKNTEVLEIKVTDSDPNLAAQIANQMAEEFSDAVIDIKKVDSVSIIDTSVPPVSPIKPKKTMNVAIAFAVGLMASVGLAFLLEFLDKSIKTTSDVENVLGIPVLGMIPNYELDKQ